MPECCLSQSVEVDDIIARPTIFDTTPGLKANGKLCQFFMTALPIAALLCGGRSTLWG